MIRRALTPHLLAAARELPVVTLTGPRQSGKTTLCRGTFPDKPYVNLERLDDREIAISDPRGFLGSFPDGAIIDEVQHVPELLSYIQADVDEDDRPGRFILTGSQQLNLNAAISQTLAGRTAILHLLPLSLEERKLSDLPVDDLWLDVFRGGYPRIYDRNIDPVRWYADYLTTYVERDVQQLRDIGDLRSFREFMRLAAGRSSQEIVMSTLAGDVGVSHPTIKAWLGVLEASFLATTLPGWARSIRKQVVKAPKLHLLDTGVICSLLGIHEPNQLKTHPLRGSIFESWVVSEVLKAFFNAGRAVTLKHFRETRGLEIDLLVERGLRISLIECKSGATTHPSFLQPLREAKALLLGKLPGTEIDSALVYGGTESRDLSDAVVCAWSDVPSLTSSLTATSR